MVEIWTQAMETQDPVVCVLSAFASLSVVIRSDSQLTVRVKSECVIIVSKTLDRHRPLGEFESLREPSSCSVLLF